MTYLTVTLKVPINPRYPTRPGQPPVAQAVEQHLTDALRHAEVYAKGERLEYYSVLKEERG